MRPGTLLLPFALLLGACGGSSSETPWPAEPARPPLGPADEDEETSPDGPTNTSATPEREGEGSADPADAGR